MTFAEFSHKVRQDARLTELINRYDDLNALTDEEVHEMVARSAAICDKADDFEFGEEEW